MKQSKWLTALFSVVLCAALLTACAPTIVVLQEAPKEETPAVSDTEKPSAAEGAVKTGVSFTAAFSASDAAAGEAAGLAQTDITAVAVTVDENGVIDRCVIDMVQAKIGFDEAGQLTGDISAPILSKNELGTNYGMGKVSSIGKEWNEQAAALAAYVEGLTLDEVKGIAFNSDGKAEDADLASGATMYLGGFLAAIEQAVNSAVHLGAQQGDELVIETVTSASGSKNASAEEAGLAQAYCTMAAVTLDGETITSCYLDAIQANVNFDAAGKVTGEYSGDAPSKNTLGDNYGMSKVSAIGDWYVQAANFAEYVTGKTIGEVSGIAVSEGKATDADLVSSVTMKIGDFMTLIAKAGE